MERYYLVAIVTLVGGLVVFGMALTVSRLHAKTGILAPVMTGDPSPEIVYPSDQTVFPRNIYRTLFQWHTKGFTQFRLVYEGPNSTVTVYTDGVHALCTGKTPAAGCWEVDETAWNFIAGSNAGAARPCVPVRAPPPPPERAAPLFFDVISLSVMFR